MYRLKLKNDKGNTLEFNNNSPFVISQMQGLTPPSAKINTTEIALMDGAKFNSSKVNMRTIRVAFYIMRDAAKSRIEIYNTLRTKQRVYVLYKSDYRDVEIEGYVESIDIDLFARRQVCTVSILCPFPYFKDAQEMINEMDSVIGMFSFPFATTVEKPIPFGYIEPLLNITLMNDGDVSCGMLIELYARGTVENPKIFNYLTGEYIGLNFTMRAGDNVFIDTHAGEKTITLLREGVFSNIFNSRMTGSTWLQLETGENTFTYETKTGTNSLNVTFHHMNLFEGV